jgi:hypothetical protein
MAFSLGSGWDPILIGAWLAMLLAYLTTPSSNEIATFVDQVYGRYTSTNTDVQNKDRAVVYIHRELDRQINKVRGILTFNGIFFVVARTYYHTAQDLTGEVIAVAAVFYLLISIAVALVIFIVRWVHQPDYADFQVELQSLATVVRERTFWINYAAIMSLASAVAVAILLIFRDQPMPPLS